MASPKLLLVLAFLFATAVALFACFVWLVGWPWRALFRRSRAHRGSRAPRALAARAR
ncbi:MAG: hypothetical protein HY908_03500 [Myxococcales bacterium]|nr:hypothetical protein [Myxococcales bacterium]